MFQVQNINHNVVFIKLQYVNIPAQSAHSGVFKESWI